MEFLKLQALAHRHAADVADHLTASMDMISVPTLLQVMNATVRPVYRDKGTPPKKGRGSSFSVTKLPHSLDPKGQRPLLLPHSP